MTIKLVNESALGIYHFSWKSGTGGRCEVLWCQGAPFPSFTFWISGRGRMSSLIPIREPERFGWVEPRNLADFKAFAERYAAACEEPVTV
jgi:hypothetical protein